MLKKTGYLGIKQTATCKPHSTRQKKNVLETVDIYNHINDINTKDFYIYQYNITHPTLVVALYRYREDVKGIPLIYNGVHGTFLYCTSGHSALIQSSPTVLPTVCVRTADG